jgi:hypothetical protein
MDIGARRSTACSEGWGARGTWRLPATGSTGQYWLIPTGTNLPKACSGVQIVGRETNGTGRYWPVLTGTAFQKACSGVLIVGRETNGTGRYCLSKGL